MLKRCKVEMYMQSCW